MRSSLRKELIRSIFRREVKIFNSEWPGLQQDRMGMPLQSPSTPGRKARCPRFASFLDANLGDTLTPEQCFGGGMQA